MTVKPHIQDKIGPDLSGRVTTILITLKRGDIFRYRHKCGAMARQISSQSAGRRSKKESRLYSRNI